MSGRMEQDTVRREKGFVAYYLRRPLTMMEKINKLCLDTFGRYMVKETFASSRAYDYFRGIHTHHQVLPRHWGHPSG
jgi:hypothetical protein